MGLHIKRKVNLMATKATYSIQRRTASGEMQETGICHATYNIVLIPAALLSPLVPFLQGNAPIFAAAAMALSSVTVVSNSLRLRRKRNERTQ